MVKMKNFKRGRSGGFRESNRSFSRYQPKRSSSRIRYRSKDTSLNPLAFVNRAVDVVEDSYEPVNSFLDFPLDKTVKNNIRAHGFSEPTAIQDKAMFPILEGRDLVGIANTGTGKTAAFLLPLITKVSKDRRQKVLIVTPTRELAAQIRDEFEIFSSGLRVFSVLCIGGSPLNNQAHGLSRQPNFVIGTPGRIKDLAKRRILNLNSFGNIVLDEVDRMLDLGFINDIQNIISFLPKSRQSLFFSATVPKETKVVMQSFLVDPVTVSVKTGVTPRNVDQDIIRTRGRNKIEILYKLLIKEEFKKVLIFGRTKRGVNKLEEKLKTRGFKVVAIHSNKSQGQRSRALKMLKNNEASIMVATDVASRGIDINDLTHVINYDTPGTYNDYVHRIGRTGRVGKKGVALTFVD
jgi:ATP-dependent RNA helicase RhlE